MKAPAISASAKAEADRLIAEGAAVAVAATLTAPQVLALSTLQLCGDRGARSCRKATPGLTDEYQRARIATPGRARPKVNARAAESLLDLSLASLTFDSVVGRKVYSITAFGEFVLKQWATL